MASSLLAKEIVEARRQDEARFQRRKTAALKAAIVEEERARKREIAQRIKAEKQRQARRAQREADRMASGFDGGFASGDPEDLKDIFEEFDADGSGSIDIAELGEALTKLLGKKPQKKVVRDVMKSADADGNGELDFEEFITLAGSGELQEKIMMNPKFRVMHEVREGKRGEKERQQKALAEACATLDREQREHEAYKRQQQREAKAEWKRVNEEKHRHLAELAAAKAAEEKAARARALEVRRERQAQFKQRSKEYWKVCGRRREAISKNWMLFDEMRREMLGEHISQAEEKLTTLRHAATQSSSQAMLRATQSPPPRVRPTTAL